MLGMEEDVEDVKDCTGQKKDKFEGVSCSHHYLVPQTDCIVMSVLSVFDSLVDHKDDVQDGC